MRRHTGRCLCRRILQSGALLVLLALTGYAAEPERIRVERKPVAGGAELITWFEQLPAGADKAAGHAEMPILSALNDTLSSGDPGDDRLRQVWAFTFNPPSVVQRLESTIPFLYYRVGIGQGNSSGRPKPVLDLGAPSKGTTGRVAMAIAQSEVINPAGAAARLTSRSYGGNLGEYRTAHLWEALDVISTENGEDSPGASTDEFEILQSRLELNGRLLGGLVSDEALPRFYDSVRTERTETRGHNWELLRQAAENNGLYFQPMAIGGVPNAFGMLWISRADLEDRSRRFDPQFLKIENPFADDRLRQWKGYTQTWNPNRDHHPDVMIPLALYSLDYPGVPLLLIDFRRAGGPRRKEMAVRFADDVTAGVLGYTGFGHLGFLALKTSWLFVDKRHGGTTNRAARARAFIQLRHALGVDDSLDPPLRAQLAQRLEALDVDPIERTWDQEVKGAWAQYDALVKYAQDPQGLPKLVQADREQEARALAHEAGARAMIQLAHAGSFGLYHHEDGLSAQQVEEISEQRKEALLRRTPVTPAPAVQSRAPAAGAGE